MKRSVVILGLLCLTLSGWSQGTPARTATKRTATPITGAERIKTYLPLLKGKRVALFANQTSMVGQTHLADTLLRLGVDIKVIFGPEHGFRGDADAGEKVGNYTDKKTGIPVVSLYGAKRRPDEKDLAEVDIMLFDIQDVGVRFYTFISSLEAYLQSAMEYHKPLIVLDRPNPNGFYVDGPVLDIQYRSFIGMQPIPIVYGLTIGEYARMLLGEGWVKDKSEELKAAQQIAPPATQAIASEAAAIASESDAPVLTTLRPAQKERAIAEPMTIAEIKNSRGCGDTESLAAQLEQEGFSLLVICCENYTHRSLYELPVRPSPNLPNMSSIYWYPSTCFFEGTALSEGRGTDKPFSIFGHPSLPKNLVSFVPRPNEGAKNSKHYGKTCYGWDLSGTPQEVLKKTGGRIQLQWLIQAYRLFPEKDSFFLLPKSGDMKGSFFNKLAGNNELWQQIREGQSEEAIKKSWQPALDQYKAIRKKYLLYEDFE